jgi:hypothetical protein
MKKRIKKNINIEKIKILNAHSILLFFYQSLFGSVVIYVELGREDHSLIPRNYDWEGARTT